METMSPISFKQARLNLDKKLIFLDAKKFCINWI